jgi:formylglycine-generating enzyme
MNRLALFLLLLNCGMPAAGQSSSARYFDVVEDGGRVSELRPILRGPAPAWSRDVLQTPETRSPAAGLPVFSGPIRYVLPPEDPGEPFLTHNHQPSVTWLPNGDLMAIWYSTAKEQGPELTVLASRLRSGAASWDPSSCFFKSDQRNMHGSALFHDGNGTIHHLNGMAPANATGWAKLALLHRTSTDNGATWSIPRAIGPDYQGRQQVISGTIRTRDGTLVQPCDAVPGGQGGTALHLSKDGGKSWSDPGHNQPKPIFKPGATGHGTIAGIHAGVVELTDGRWMALGRGDDIDGRMPMSISADLGQTWTYSASPFPPIAGGQRLVLIRLREGPLLVVSFTCTGREHARSRGMDFIRADGSSFKGYGLFAAISEDDGKTWPVRKLITPGKGGFDGGAWTGRFTATPDNAEHAGYLTATQAPDGTIHLLSSALHYRFNLAWLRTAAASP